MRISILVSADSANKIQALLAAQPLSTRASIARQAFELGLKTLAEEAEQPEPLSLKPEPISDAEYETEIGPLLEVPDLVEVPDVPAKPKPEPAQPAPEPPNWPPLELLVEDESDEDRELAELIDSI
ncbi:MAG: hypothetical protein WDO74_17990 [Pseudomonadota bacterium]